MPAFDPDSGMAFESIAFPDQHAEISWTEERDRGKGVAIIKTLLIENKNLCPDEWKAMIDALVVLVEAAQVVLRDPPETIPVRK